MFASDCNALEQGDVVTLDGLRDAIGKGNTLATGVKGKPKTLTLEHRLSPRQVDVLLRGGLINWMRERTAA